MHATANYDDLIHQLGIYNNKIATRNASLQAQVAQLTQHLSRPLEHELARVRESIKGAL